MMRRLTQRKTPPGGRGFEPVGGPMLVNIERATCIVFSRLSLVPSQQRVARHAHRNAE